MCGVGIFSHTQGGRLLSLIGLSEGINFLNLCMPVIGLVITTRCCFAHMLIKMCIYQDYVPIPWQQHAYLKIGQRYVLADYVIIRILCEITITDEAR